ETVETGDTDPNDAYDPSVGWTSLGKDVFDGLGYVGCENPPEPGATPLLTQYVEGSSSNKAIEIANLTTGDIVLDGYTLELYSNGNTSANSTETLAGTLAAGSVLVLANSSASAEILAIADGTSGTVNWNGDDAIVLRNAASDVVDSIGQLGTDPGSAWTNGGVSTANDTMCRIDTITTGDTIPDDAYDPSVEWTSLGQDVLTGLGEIGCEAPPVVAVPAFIHEIQGSGLASPLDGTRVIVQGVVTADHQDGDFNGWFMQDTDANADADPATSNGIFVFEDGNTVDVAVGDVVQLEGDVDEFYDMTQLTNISDVTVLSSGNAITATVVSLPWATLEQPEQYEGMYITLPQTLTISEYFNFDRFGEIVLTVGRAAQPTAVFEPGSPEAASLAITNQLGRITLDDNRTSQNPDPAIHPNGAVFDMDNLFRGGDTVAHVTGVMNYSFDLYRIQPTQGADYTAVNARTAAPDSVGGTLKVASFNVLNYFTTFGSRGADNLEEFNRQRDKIITAISVIDADIVGLMEIENNTAAIIDLVEGLNAANGAGTYAYVDTGAIGDDEIKVAFIYKSASVELSGDYQILDSSVDPLFDDTKNRPALAQTFTENANGESVTVVVNHLKSKSSECGPGDDDPEAGNCNLTRTNAATALVNWLAGPGFDDDVLVIGDLNSYDKEDPIDALKTGGYTDLIFDFLGEEAYSYVYSGQWGYLDYAMANASVAESVTGTTVWHINADEADLIDYDTSFKNDAQDALYAPDQYRSSDHDPVIVGLDLTPPDVTGPEIDAEFDTIYAGYHTGYYTVDFSCTDDVDPNPSCDATINGIDVDDGQRVFLIKSGWGQPWHRHVGSTLYIKDRSFTLTVVGTDTAGNTTTETAEPEFRTWHRHHKSI
ncbi:MAG: ExeM/NucH family extracellular endonuclease, partial [bacterium]|nr:ExeM/NucH family extracellular endonuclease [bacterium]